MEIVCRFAQTVQVRGLRQTRPEPEILRLEDQTGRRRIEQLLEIANENGFAVCENTSAELAESTPSSLCGRGQTDSWIWNTCSAAS
jgi:hypothetical protein